MKEIQPGYLLKVTTWENDADNYRTIELDGLSESDVQFYIKVAELFKSAHSWPRDKDQMAFGNEDVSDAPYEPIDEIAQAHRAAGYTVPEAWDVEKAKVEDAEWFEKYGEDFYNEPLYDLIGIWNEGQMYRVFESYEVFYVPENSIQNVTKKFKNDSIVE